MAEMFECKVSYDNENEEGKITKIKEEYLVDAVSFIEAETRLSEKLFEILPGEFHVEAIKREKVSEIIKIDGGTVWFKNKVEFNFVDDNGKTKKSKVIIYLQSADIKNVAGELAAKLSNSTIDYNIRSITKTNILNVFEYNEQKQGE